VEWRGGQLSLIDGEGTEELLLAYLPIIPGAEAVVEWPRDEGVAC